MVQNQTLVKIAKENDEVKVDSIGGSLVVYNYDSYRVSNIFTRGYIFTGIYLDFTDHATLDVTELDMNPATYTIYKKGLYVFPARASLGEPMASVTFVPRTPNPIFDTFYGRFINIDKEILCK